MLGGFDLGDSWGLIVAHTPDTMYIAVRGHLFRLEGSVYQFKFISPQTRLNANGKACRHSRIRMI